MSNPIPDRLIDALAAAPLTSKVTNQSRFGRRRSRRNELAIHYTLLLVCAGLTTPQIADELEIPFWTAQDRVKRLLSMYGARTRAQLAAMALRDGMELPTALACRRSR